MPFMPADAFEPQEDRITIERAFIESYPAAMRMALKNCGNNRAIAEDAVGRTFLRIVEHREMFLRIPDEKKIFFIARTAKYRAIDLMKEEAAYAETADEASLVSEEAPPDFTLEQKEDVSFAKSCIRELPRIHKTVLEFHFRYDLSHHEISKLLGITESHVSVRLHRAIKKLREVAKKKMGSVGE